MFLVFLILEFLSRWQVKCFLTVLRIVLPRGPCEPIIRTFVNDDRVRYLTAKLKGDVVDLKSLVKCYGYIDMVQGWLIIQGSGEPTSMVELDEGISQRFDRIWGRFSITITDRAIFHVVRRIVLPIRTDVIRKNFAATAGHGHFSALDDICERRRAWVVPSMEFTERLLRFVEHGRRMGKVDKSKNDNDVRQDNRQ